jgi:hypothetical protein
MTPISLPRMATITLLAATLLTACGGGDSGGGANPIDPAPPVSPAAPTAPATPTDTVLTGTTFPLMVGLNYRTATQSGVTDESGRYRYKAGEQVAFWLAGAELADVPAAAEVTPLSGDDLAASNMLRLFKALDADGDMANGLVFPALPSAGTVPVDFSVEAEVADALALVDTIAALPPATDPQVAGALATARSKAAAMPVTYGSDFSSFLLHTVSSCPASPALPVRGRVTLQGQPNWATGAMSGEITLTLGDGTVLATPFTSASGTSAQGYRYKLSRTTARLLASAAHGPANGRVIELRTFAPGLAAPCDAVVMELRDQRLPNLLPVAKPGVALVNGFYTYSYTGNLSSYDVDGRVVLTEWSASDGTRGTGPTFQVSHRVFSEVTVTLTVTDDEGGKSSRTWTLGNATKSLERVLDMLSAGYHVTRDGQYSTYYKVDLSRTKVVEVECDDTAKACSETTFNLSDVNTQAFLDGMSLQLGGFVYTDPQGRSTGFSKASTLPEGYTVRSGSGAASTSRTSGKSGSGVGLALRSAGTAEANGGTGGASPGTAPSAGTANCGDTSQAPTLDAIPPACYKGRLFTFGWATTMQAACDAAVVNDDLAFYKAQKISRCYCKSPGKVNGVEQPFVCRVTFDVGL